MVIFVSCVILVAVIAIIWYGVEAACTHHFDEMECYNHWLINTYLHYVRTFKQYKQGTATADELKKAEDDLLYCVTTYNGTFSSIHPLNPKDFLIDIDEE